VEGNLASSRKDKSRGNSVSNNDIISVPIVLDPSKVAILHALLSFKDLLSIRKIIEITGLNRKTVERHLESLKYLGFVYEEGRRYTVFRPIKQLAFFKVVRSYFLLIECVTLNVSPHSHYFLRFMELKETELKGNEYRFAPEGAIIICSYEDSLSASIELYTALVQKLTKVIRSKMLF